MVCGDHIQAVQLNGIYLYLLSVGDDHLYFQKAEVLRGFKTSSLILKSLNEEVWDEFLLLRVLVIFKCQ